MSNSKLDVSTKTFVILQKSYQLQKKIAFFVVFFLAQEMNLSAQTDSLTEKKVIFTSDSISQPTQRKFSPQKAALFSAILPGLGQGYNRKYWKIPLIYAGGAVLGYYIYFNNNAYLEFRDSFFAKVNNRPDLDPFPNRPLQNVNLNKDYWKRNRDLLIIVSTLVYGLNIVDAIVDAHLKTFDVSDNLAFRFKPSLEPLQSQQMFVGVSLVCHFKR